MSRPTACATAPSRRPDRSPPSRGPGPPGPPRASPPARCSVRAREMSRVHSRRSEGALSTNPEVARRLARVKSVRLVVEELMNAEVSELIGAAYGERNPEGRMTKRSGYRGREWDTRVGVIELQIPKLRQGSYFPHGLLEPRKRGERALLAVVQQAYVCGVSRRRVDQGVETLRPSDSGSRISRSEVSRVVRAARTSRASSASKPGPPQTSPTCAAEKGGCTSPRCRTPTRGRSSAGRWPPTCAPPWSSTRSR